MKKLLNSSLLIAAFAILTSCGSKESTPEKEAAKYNSPKEVAMALLEEMEEIVKVSSSVTDAASATKAAEKMEIISENMNALATELSAMEKPTAEEKKEIQAEMEKRLEAAMSGMTPPKPEDINMDEVEEIQEIMSAAQMKFATESQDSKETFDAYFETN